MLLQASVHRFSQGVNVSNAQRALEQLLALVMASHHRCGASSPAHHFASLPPLATAPLWDWCLRDTEVLFGLYARPPSASVNYYYTFGVSASLMSLTTRNISCHGNWPLWVTDPIHGDPTHLVITQQAMCGHEVLLLNVATKEKRLIFSNRTQPSYHRANHKWWLDYGHVSGTLVIVSLLQQETAQFVGHAQVNILECDTTLKAKSDLFSACMGIIFNKQAPDEALFMLSASYEIFLLVIDVKKTFTTGTVATLSMTQCLFPKDISRLHPSSLLMNKLNGEHVFICYTGDSVFEVAERVGTCKLISSKVQSLSQLSSSLFCTLNADYGTVAIWDCNNARGASRPLRVLQATPAIKANNVVAQSGFIFHNRPRTKQAIEVTDSTGFLIGVINFPVGEVSFVRQNDLTYIDPWDSCSHDEVQWGLTQFFGTHLLLMHFQIFCQGLENTLGGGTGVLHIALFAAFPHES
ncbi:hypothetical protein Pelo_5019 [Pelomyxa schiedti]|nr:hypothetical protein Pelo_5019 [Pelomyxa schiedti]